MPITKVRAAFDDGTFKSYMEATKQRIESELSRLVLRVSSLSLSEKIGYALLSRGKRLRPLLVILSAESVGGNAESVVSLAVALELLHTATLVHDDILDQDSLRRGLPTLHKRWSVNDAILVGDALISLAINLTADYGREIIKITSETGLALCDGEYIDVSETSIKMSQSEYLKKIGKKSASLFKASAQCGAIAGGGSGREVECLADFGENYGIAYQLSDDVSDTTSVGNGVPKDLRKRRISLPLIHLSESSSLAERKMLTHDLQTVTRTGHEGGHAAVDRILQNLKAKGSLDYCRKKIDGYINQAITDIQPLRDTNYKSYLIKMVKSLSARTQRFPIIQH